MGDERVVQLKVGCHPDAAVSGAVLLQSEEVAFLVFNAMSDDKNTEGRYEAVGTAVVEFKHLMATRFGSPNDEALPEHPLYRKGLAEGGYGIYEVLESSWAAEVAALARTTAERIWGHDIKRPSRTRHFIFTFHDSTFECLAEDLSVSLHHGGYKGVLQELAARLAGG